MISMERVQIYTLTHDCELTLHEKLPHFMLSWGRSGSTCRQLEFKRHGLEHCGPDEASGSAITCDKNCQAT